MTAPTPEQMRALAEDNDVAGKVWGLRGFHTKNAAALRAAADQLEAVQAHESGPRTPDGGNDDTEQSADGEPYDPLADPANARVVAALHASRPYFAPPVHEDKVIAMLRARGLWKPEHDDD